MIEFGRNCGNEIRDVEHHNLTPARVESNKLASVCPFCNEGLLLCIRDAGTLVLKEIDCCTLCGQIVKYEDIADMRKKDWASVDKTS